MKRRFVAERFSKPKAKLALDPEALKKYDDIIDLSIGDTDIVTDKAIIDKAYNDALAGYTRYGEPKGDPELIDAIIKAWGEDFGEKIAPQNVLVTASSLLGMTIAMAAVLDPGDEVIVFAPYFTLYRPQAEFSGGVVREVPLDPANNYRIDEEQLRSFINEKTKVIVFNNPVNPTGIAYGKEDMEIIRRVAIEYDLLVMADEIYTFYLYDGEFSPIRLMPGMAERTITLNSFSKNFLMTGWRVGYIIAEPYLIDAIYSVSDFLIYSTPSISQRAAIKALEIRKDVYEKYVPIYRDRVFYSIDRIKRIPYLDLVPPGGTFYIFPSFRRTGLSTKEFTDLLFEKCHIIVAAGNLFGDCGDGSFRIACTVPKEQLEEAYDRMEKLTF